MANGWDDQEAATKGVPDGDIKDDTYGLDAQKTITNGQNERIFTEEELSNAMTQSTLKPSQRERE